LRATPDLPACVLRPGDPLPDRGIVVGEATCAADLAAWARAVDDRTLPAGAAEFFGAYLQVQGYGPTRQAPAEGCLSPRDTALFVCGSTSETSRSFCARCEGHGVPVLRMPAELLDVPPADPVLAQACVHRWAGEVIRALETHPRAMVAIDLPLRREPGVPQALSAYLGAAVQEVITERPVDHLFVEGGATAVSLIRRFGWERLRVRFEFSPGVVCMQVEGADGPLVTMKPGSYAWPEPVLALV
jgi:uncharacterized protein YgbK (DUF1537 family)